VRPLAEGKSIFCAKFDDVIKIEAWLFRGMRDSNVHLKMAAWKATPHMRNLAAWKATLHMRNLAAWKATLHRGRWKAC